jgi:hypothetical protein
MKTKERITTFLFLSLAVIVMLILSGGLSKLVLSPGQPFSLGSGWRSELGAYDASPLGEVLVTILRIAFTLALLLLPFTIIYLIISPEARKKALQDFMIMATFILIYYLLAKARTQLTDQETEPRLAEGMFEMGQNGIQDLAPLPEFAADPPRWLIFLASLGLALVVAALVIGIVRNLQRRPQPSDDDTLEQLAQGAEDALQAIQGGADLKNTVVRCYFEMSQVVNKERGLQRKREMTAREFENYLEKAGLPDGPVRQLTRLFEDVRYGTKSPGDREERQAIASLTAIVKACRSPS